LTHRWRLSLNTSTIHSSSIFSSQFLTTVCKTTSSSWGRPTHTSSSSCSNQSTTMTRMETWFRSIRWLRQWTRAHSS
jgi:hypothetical protein